LLEKLVIFVSARLFLKVDAKFTTLGQLSNKSLGTDVNNVHALKVELKVVTKGLLSNKPLGTVVILLNEKVSTN
jgi:hypothetical protein